MVIGDELLNLTEKHKKALLIKNNKNGIVYREKISFSMYFHSETAFFMVLYSGGLKLKDFGVTQI